MLRSSLACRTDGGGKGEVMGQPVTENVVLSCWYRKLRVFIACQSNESFDQPERT